MTSSQPQPSFDTATPPAGEATPSAPDGQDLGLKGSATRPVPILARIWAQPEGKVGLVLTAAMVVLTVIGYFFAPPLTGHSPTEFIGLPFTDTGAFGTDNLGRSVWTRFVAGGLILLVTAFLATLLGMIVGTFIGMLAGYAGGKTDAVLMRLNDVLLAFPQLIFAMLAIVIFGPSATVLVLVIGLTHAPRIARVARAATLDVTNEDFIRAAQMYSMPHWKILTREILPNITGPLAVEAGLRLTYSIGSIASLSFLGLGIQPPAADWGLMINENRIALSLQPWGVLLPVIAIALLTIGTNTLADAASRATASTSLPPARELDRDSVERREHHEPIHRGAAAASRPAMEEQADSPEVVLRVRDLRLGTLDGTEILHGIDFDLRRGEIVGLVGESGSGKTTAGLATMGHFRQGLSLYDGTVTLFPTSRDAAASAAPAVDVLSLDEEELRALRGERIAYVPQDPALSLNPSIRIGEQILEVLEVHGYAGDRKARVREVMREVDLPDTEDYLRRWPHQLSGGQQQRVGIAMAFAPRPDVLILDEPTTGLDVTTQAHVLDTIRELTRTNQVASLYITHDLAVVSELADRVMVMLRGDIVEEGPAELVLRDPQHPYTAKLLASIPDLPGRRDITGHGRPRPYARAAAGAPTAPLLEVSGLGMAYGDTQVLRSIDLALEEGESILLLGESGSGKTTLARAIAGLNPGYTGDVALSGTVLEHGSRQRTLQQRQDIQYIFQSPYSSLNPRRTIGESLSVPLEMSGRLSPHERRQAVEDVLEAVQLDRSFYHRRPGDLSGGERQRAAIGRALINAPKVLVCDEITSALDVSVQASILKLLAELREERGLSLLFVTHNIALARHTATKVAVLNKGVLVDQGPVDQVLEHPSHEYTAGLLASIPEL